MGNMGHMTRSNNNQIFQSPRDRDNTVDDNLVTEHLNKLISVSFTIIFKKINFTVHFKLRF